jgi:plastocyanin
MPTPKQSVKTCLLLAAAMLAACSGSKPAQQSEAAPAKAAYYKVDPATAGSVSGKVVFTGKRPPRKKVDMDEDPVCAKLHSTPVFDDSLVVNPNGTLANVFIYVKHGLEGKTFEPPADPVTIDQHGCWFIPRVLGIQTGQTLKVTNSDPLTHNIHPRAHINREWNQSQSAGADPLTRRFMRPEIMIRVKCNIHSWMHAWIGVVDNPYFAVTGTDGSFGLKNLPPGNYTIAAWQEDLGNSEQQVTVPPSGTSELVFTYKGE